MLRILCPPIWHVSCKFNIAESTATSLRMVRKLALTEMVLFSLKDPWIEPNPLQTIPHEVISCMHTGDSYFRRTIGLALRNAA
jgi:hypothetical protein